MQKRSAGLVVLTNISSYGGLVAVLQVRGDFNHEKMAPESFPGACQITAHGKCEGGESVRDGLLREIREELGDEFANLISVNFNERNELNRVETEDKLVVNYGVVLPPDFLKNLQLTASSGGIRFIREDQLDCVANLKTFDKVVGVKDRSVTAMFGDEVDALRLAFEKNRN